MGAARFFASTVAAWAVPFWRPRFLAATLLLSACALFGVAPAAMATFQGTNGRIAFLSDRDRDLNHIGWYQIYSMNPDGSNVTRLTTDGLVDGDPAWSADGTRIAYSIGGSPSAGSGLWVMGEHGERPTQLTFPPSGSSDSQPAWSPDDQQIAFTRTSSDGVGQVWVVNVDGSDPRALTSGSDSKAPAWSPDGKQIAFQSGSPFSGESSIDVMGADGSAPTQLTEPPSGVGWFVTDENPNWSPDGKQIAFDSNRSVEFTEHIYTMTASGGSITEIGDGPDYSPVWSPDGTEIAFASTRSAHGRVHIWKMSADGSAQTMVTADNDSVQDDNPSWQTGPLVVNSTGDASDANPANGICDTGNTMTVAGKVVAECTLRAAIEVADHLDNDPTIAFDIQPGGSNTFIGGEPVINAPHGISDNGYGENGVNVPMAIDGTTQPGGQVELAGSSQAGTVGLPVGASGVKIMGLDINGYSVDLEVGRFLLFNSTRVADPAGIEVAGAYYTIPDSSSGETTGDVLSDV